MEAETTAAAVAGGGGGESGSITGAKNMKVMVAIDESENSFYALTWVLDHLSDVLVSETEPVPDNQETGLLTLVHVQQPFQHFVYPAGGTVYYGTPAVLESTRKAQKECSTVLLARALQMCKAKKIKGETLILEGDPKEKLCEAAEEIHPDLLVMGSRGLGAIKRAFLGSVSDYCTHYANCPVLIVKPPITTTTTTKGRDSTGRHNTK